ncbi:hypothetical protein F2Q68_00006347 [Brassica cretica]|uniref:F-box associated beta-propeller type 3 domain-containing protein n=1 Tax=Brassica cretica TaxID=69181 RepID=A0A8S9JKN9_BRACR|nr:hypothetical protein F2Q68_00006347 [Brassica cretica]
MSFATQLPSISARFLPTCSSCCGKWVFSVSLNIDSPPSSFVEVTATGEIVLMEDYYHSKPFYVFYFHPERNTVKRLEVQGFEHHGGGSRVYASVDHVDDLTFNMKSWQLHQDVPPRCIQYDTEPLTTLLGTVKPRDLTLEPTDRAVAPPNSGQAFLFLGPCGMVKSILYSGGWKFRGGEEGCGVFGGGASGVCGDVVGGV